MCLASNLIKEAAAHADSAAAADKALREIDHEKTTFTRREIESKRHDLVIIEDRVYDADRFQWAHPGGSLFVAMFGGRDGTLAFQSYHMRSFPHEKLRPYLRGRLAPGETITRFDEDHLELSKKLGGAAPYFAPTYQKYKAGFIWVLAFALEAYALTVRRSWLLATCLGFLYAMIGLNIQHDANHGIDTASFDLPAALRHRCAFAAMAWRWPWGRLDAVDASMASARRHATVTLSTRPRESPRVSWEPYRDNI
jgi:cytochrome b involved in lipid metabolism